AEDGIRDRNVTGVQTCALPISAFEVKSTIGGLLFPRMTTAQRNAIPNQVGGLMVVADGKLQGLERTVWQGLMDELEPVFIDGGEIGRASCRERMEVWGVGGRCE